MITLIIIVIGVILTALGLLLYIRHKGVSLTNYTRKSPLFLSGDEMVNYLTAKAGLTSEEKTILDKLCTLGGTRRLHMALDDAEIGLSWIQNTRRALHKSLVFDEDEKENLESSLYEIHRKISLARSSLHPMISRIGNIATGQSMEMSAPKGSRIVGNFASGSSKHVLIILEKDQFHLMEKSYPPRSKIIISFWREAESSGYTFKAEVDFLVEKKGSFQLGAKVLSPLKRAKMRSYPRKEAQIPVRFRTVPVNQGSNGAKNCLGPLVLGFINNISPKGAVVLSNHPLPVESQIQLNFPIINTIVNIDALVRSVHLYNSTYALGVEFIDIPQKAILYIYRFLYPDVEG